MGGRRFLRSLVRDRTGSSIVELAIAAPVLALLVAGVSDLGRGLSAKFALNQAIHRSLEKAAVSNRRTDYAYLKAETAAAAGIDESRVSVDAWLECDGARKSNFSGSCASGEQIGRYVKVTATSRFTPMFRYSFLQLQTDDDDDDDGDNAGTIKLQADAAVRVQ